MNASSVPISLTFKIGDESFPTVMSEKDALKSPFADTIKRAKDKFYNIAESLSIVRDERFKKNWLTETPSNMIALLGDRGSGKTSCMRTLIKILNDEQNADGAQPLKKWLFSDEIDPSFFDENHNILQLFVGSLFGIYKRDIKDLQKKNRSDQEILRCIHENFRNVKAALSYLDDHRLKEDDDEYEIDALRHLDEGGKIRVILKDLIDKILKYENKDFIVLSIDDLDLNISQSYEMMEHINKFLRLPNVIILIAAKYVQLFNSICLNLSESYKNIDYRVSHKDIALMAERYLNKAIPLTNRFPMPETESYMDSTLIIIDKNGKQVYDAYEPVVTKVPSLIFEKTRFLFYNSTGVPSRVIPRNLRDLRMLVTMLVNMKPIDSKNNDNFDVIKEQNKQQFKDYFFTEWLGVIDPDYRTFATSLLEEENIAKINKFVISNLYDIFISKTEKIDDIRKEIEEIKRLTKTDSYSLERLLLFDILNPANSYWNVSIGDVVFIINYIKKKTDSNNTLDLLFFIESFYSMKLYETYDDLTSYTDDQGYIPEYEERSDAPELKNDIKADVPDFFKLVGGSFFALTGDYFTPLPSHGFVSQSREISLVNAKFLKDEIKRIEADYKKYKEANKNPEILPDDFYKRLRFCEFFMLCISHRQDQKISDKNPRLINEPVYFKHFGNNAKNLVFNIGSPFVNAICPEFAYNRFSDKIYEIAKEFKYSLVNRMIRLNTREKNNQTWELMSKAAIRNMEVLEDLTSWLHDRREDNKPNGKDLVGVLLNFYGHLDFNKDFDSSTKYFVKTYDKTGNKADDDYYYIDFSVISILNKVLNEFYPKSKKSFEQMTDKENKDWKETIRLAGERLNLFNAIFSYNDIFQHKITYYYDEIAEVLNNFLSPKSVSKMMGPNTNQNFSMMQLAELLAKIRIEYKLDFTLRLPLSLRLYYQNCLNIEIHNSLQPLSEHKFDLETDLKNLEAEKSEILAEFSDLREERSHLEKDKRSRPKRLADLEKQIASVQNQLNIASDRISFGATSSSELNRLNKDEDSAKIRLFDLQAEINELRDLDKKHSSMIEDINKKLNSTSKKLKDIEKAIRDNKLELENLTRSIQNKEDNLKKTVTLEYLEV